MIISIQVQNEHEKELRYIYNRIKKSKFKIVEDIVTNVHFMGFKVEAEPHQLLDLNEVADMWLTMDLTASSNSDWVFRPISYGEIL